MQPEIKATTKWLDDPEVFRVNQLPARSDHLWFKDQKEMTNKKSSFKQSLNGSWKFLYAKNPQERSSDFYEESFQGEFEEILVPGHIQMAGYDKIHYTNRSYPWEGHTFRRPAKTLPEFGQQENSFSEAAYNPVGSYRKTFDLEEGLKGKDVRIHFEGVEEAFYVWLNGHFVGYAEDSFTPSEFDLTPFIKETGNILAVEVYKLSTAAFIEDQDFFRFSGIFRGVSLLATPKTHVQDFWAKALVQEDLSTGSLDFQAEIATQEKAGSVKITLKDGQGNSCLEKECPIEKNLRFKEDIKNVALWDQKTPNLYDLLIEVFDASQSLVEVIPYKIGFRRVEIKDKVILLNGKKLVLNGVNRHEWSATGGRVLTLADMKQDIEIFQKNHINAVRTSHYPSSLSWYRLCDAHGIYVMSETNLESHASWGNDCSWNIPGSFPAWKEVVVDRARTHFEVLKNHASILFWSLGNEAYAGDNIQAMNAFFKEKDETRIVHYEGVYHNRAYKDVISDVDSCMYAPPEMIAAFLASEASQKPFLICEYMHSMGNSVGGLGGYVALLEQFPQYQGGFIWDYIDQAIEGIDDVTGEKVYRYGGDFDDRPSNYEFCGNGLVFANREEKPAMQEVKYYYGKYQ